MLFYAFLIYICYRLASAIGETFGLIVAIGGGLLWVTDIINYVRHYRQQKQGRRHGHRLFAPRMKYRRWPCHPVHYVLFLLVVLAARIWHYEAGEYLTLAAIGYASWIVDRVVYYFATPSGLRVAPPPVPQSGDEQDQSSGNP